MRRGHEDGSGASGAVGAVSSDSPLRGKSFTGPTQLAGRGGGGAYVAAAAALGSTRPSGWGGGCAALGEAASKYSADGD